MFICLWYLDLHKMSHTYIISHGNCFYNTYIVKTTNILKGRRHLRQQNAVVYRLVQK